ncbi:ThuA domain-containing protein [Alkalicoccus chagannorensis]|uniref:ThuA domain-containing protein n=1 Tax=Alkalicoccus chagannorensis TaxID=427072 RepID=UPI00041531C0|nr:ThuA domain-containing protein [Alkalicoccus chagannorensis]
MKITIWNENRHEKKNPEVTKVYPEGIHGALQEVLQQEGTEVRTATLDEPEHGLSEEVLDQTDVLFWWGHIAHEEVEEHIVDRVHERVLEGMGLVVLHSGHFSKIFKKLMGTSCDLKWREADETERLWVIDPSHPLVHGIGEYIELEREEMYGEHFDVPAPDEVVMLSWFEGGEVFRSLNTYHRGNGKIVYFRPGHETYATYHNNEIQQVLKNAAAWAADGGRKRPVYGHHPDPIEKIAPRNS